MYQRNYVLPGLFLYWMVLVFSWKWLVREVRYWRSPSIQ